KTLLDKLEKTLEPILDIDGVLWFLALDNAVQNDDGYWTRASDYSLYRDPKGKFHIIPHDINETFAPVMSFGFGRGGPGFGMGPGGGPGPGKGPPDGPGKGKGKGPGPGGPGGGMRPSAYELDPLIGLKDTNKPLRSRLLAVPSLKAKYLANMRTI